MLSVLQAGPEEIIIARLFCARQSLGLMILGEDQRKWEKLSCGTCEQREIIRNSYCSFHELGLFKMVLRPQN